MIVGTIIPGDEIISLAPLVYSLSKQKKKSRLVIFLTDSTPTAQQQKSLKQIYPQAQFVNLEQTKDDDFISPYLFSKKHINRTLLALPEIFKAFENDTDETKVIAPPGLYFESFASNLKSENEVLIESVLDITPVDGFIFSWKKSDLALFKAIKQSTLRVLRGQKELSDNIYQVVAETNKASHKVWFSQSLQQQQKEIFVIPARILGSFSNIIPMGLIAKFKKLANTFASKNLNFQESTALNNPMLACLSEAALWNLKSSPGFSKDTLMDTAATPPPVLSWFYRQDAELQRDYGPLATYDQQSRFIKWGIKASSEDLNLNERASNVLQFSFHSSHSRIAAKSPRSLAPVISVPWGQGLSIVASEKLLPTITQTVQKNFEEITSWPVQFIECEELIF